MNMQVHGLRLRDSVLSTAKIGETQESPAKKVETSNANSRCTLCGLKKVCVTNCTSQDSLGILRKLSNPARPLHKNEYFYIQDEVFESLYILRSGAVKTYYIDDRGVEHITGFYLPGEPFGFDGISRGRHRYAAVALDTSAICRISYKSIEREFPLHPDLQRWVMEMLCEHVYDRQEALLALRTASAEERLAMYLLDISSRLKHRGLSPVEIALPMTRRDIAGYLGLTEETMSRMFSRLQKRKVLVVKGRTIIINDLKTLQSLSTGMVGASQPESAIGSCRLTDGASGINGEKFAGGNVALHRIGNVKMLSEAV